VGSSGYKISTLLYCFNAEGEVLLMERLREPNKGLWSPPGGKLDTLAGESPHACACREAQEEIGMRLTAPDLQLLGIVSERGGEGEPHWLMFLFEVKKQLAAVPPPHAEGQFAFHRREALDGLSLPRTDREQIWPLIWTHRRGFFVAHCQVLANGGHEWVIEESRLSEGEVR
jgi:8-oxo-dGTP diphosphatase